MLLSMRIKAFRMYIALPMRCLSEVTEGFSDLMCLFKGVSRKGFAALSAADDAIAMLRNFGPLDVLDVDAGSKEGSVKVKLQLR